MKERNMGRTMRVGLAGLAIAGLAVGRNSEVRPVQARSAPQSTMQGEPCPVSDPRGGVYDPDRLKVVNPQAPCITVGGTIDCQFTAPDGDRHISLRLDKKYEDDGILTPANRLQVCPPFHLGMHLVVEDIPQNCQPRFLEPDASVNCADRGGFVSPDVPRSGTHVSVTGTYVLDTGHFNWAEIHPVFSIQKTPKTS